MRFAVRLSARAVDVIFKDYRVVPNSSILPKDEKSQTLFVSHVKWVTGQTQIAKYFSKYGKVTEVSMYFVSFFKTKFF